MKKYLAVNYAYPVYFLLILGQYFLAESLDSLYDAPASVPAVVQPAQGRPGVPGTAADGDQEARPAFPGAGDTHEKGR